MFKCEAWQLRIPYSCAGRSVTPVLFSLLPLGDGGVCCCPTVHFRGPSNNDDDDDVCPRDCSSMWLALNRCYSLAHPPTHSLAHWLYYIARWWSPINKRGDDDYDGGKYCIRYEFPYLFILGIISFYRVHGSNEPKLRGILIFSGLNWRPSMLAGWPRWMEESSLQAYRHTHTPREIPSDLSDCGDT